MVAKNLIAGESLSKIQKQNTILYERSLGFIVILSLLYKKYVYAVFH